MDEKVVIYSYSSKRDFQHTKENMGKKKVFIILFLLYMNNKGLNFS